nr:hypothetical protein [Candidatus Sigynarchaeum springense]
MAGGTSTTCGRAARAAGFPSGASWVIGLPGESAAKTAAFVVSLIWEGLDIPDVRALQVFPGTPHYQDPAAWGLGVEHASEVDTGNLRQMTACILHTSRWSL